MAYANCIRACQGDHSRSRAPLEAQHQTFLQTHRGFCEIAHGAQLQQYVDGCGWRTSRNKILDNALIGFCKVELSDELYEQAIDMARELSFRVPGLPPAKNEALSMLGAGHSHGPRVVDLLRAAKDALQRSGFVPVENGPVALDVVVHVPPGQHPWDATNYLGGVADVLEEKSRRGTLGHLGELRHVWVYRNDRQIKEVSYRQLEASGALLHGQDSRALQPSGTVMRSLGIDLAAEPPDIAACEITWLADSARGRLYTDRLDDDQLLALIESADKVGIDCPFGWPQPFVDAVASMPTPRGGPDAANLV